jgi:hypothetical protein
MESAARTPKSLKVKTSKWRPLWTRMMDRDPLLWLVKVEI